MSSSPAAVIDTNSDDPPAEKNGSVSPVTGSSPDTPPVLITACTPNHAAMPPARSMPKRSGDGERGLDAEAHEQGEPADDRQRADEAELVGDDGEDEVAVRQREVAELAVPGTDARAGEAAVGDGEESLVRLVRQPIAVTGDVEEGREAVDPPLARHHERHRRRRRHHRRPDDRRQRHPTDEGDDEDDRSHHDRRAEVGLDQARPSGEPGQQQQRLEAATHVGQVVLAPHEEVGGVDDDGELEEFRRLHGELADGDPGAGVVERDADRRERCEHAGTGDDEGGDGEASQPHEVDPQGDDETDEADAGPHQLAVEQEVRAPPPLRLHLRGGRQHHDEAEHQEGGDDDSDDVEADRRRSALHVPEAHALTAEQDRQATSLAPFGRHLETLQRLLPTLAQRAADGHGQVARDIDEAHCIPRPRRPLVAAP